MIDDDYDMFNPQKEVSSEPSVKGWMSRVLEKFLLA